MPALLKEHAEPAPERVAYADSARGVTYADLERRTRALAGHLTRTGLARGDRVAVILGNRVETMESCLAVLRAGMVGVPLDPRSSDAEPARFLKDSRAAFVTTDAAHLVRLRRLGPPYDGLGALVAGLVRSRTVPGRSTALSRATSMRRTSWPTSATGPGGAAGLQPRLPRLEPRAGHRADAPRPGLARPGPSVPSGPSGYRRAAGLSVIRNRRIHRPPSALLPLGRAPRRRRRNRRHGAKWRAGMVRQGAGGGARGDRGGRPELVLERAGRFRR
ncbi:AMP-binding protein [Streptomyces massasporeus]|uniref:AMP-binding protein n=1 Tax=Streptomyces massasporeus TaxID=67324 RepID=UPI0036EE9182